MKAFLWLPITIIYSNDKYTHRTYFICWLLLKAEVTVVYKKDKGPVLMGCNSG